MPEARLGPGLPQRRPRRARPGRARVRRPGRPAGEARGPPHRARRDRCRAQGAAGRVHRRGGRCRRRRPASRSWSATWPPRPAAPSMPPTATRRARVRRCRPRWCRCSPGRRAAGPDLWEGRPHRPAVAAPRSGRGGRRRARTAPRPGWPSSGGTCSGSPWPGPMTTSSSRAAAASPPPSWSRPSRASTRKPRSATSTTTPASGAMADRLEALRRRVGLPRTGRGAADPSRTQLLQTALGLLLQTVVGIRWLVWLLTLNGLLRGRATRGSPRCRGGGSRPAGWCCITPRDGWGSPSSAPAAAARRRARHLPAGRQRPRPALGGGEAGRRRGRRQPGRCAWISVLREGPRREDRPRRRPPHAPAGHRDADDRPAPRSSPRSTWPATGSTATGCTSARSPSAPRRPRARATPSCPVRRSGGRRGAAGSAVSGKVPPTSAGRARPRSGERRQPDGPTSARPQPGGGSSRTASPSGGDVAAPAAGRRGRRRSCSAGPCATPPTSGRRPAGVPRRPAGDGRRVRHPRRGDPRRRAAPGHRRAGGHLPGHSRIGWQVWATERMLDSARSCCSPCTPASSRRCGCGRSGPRSAREWRPRPSCCCPR